MSTASMKMVKPPWTPPVDTAQLVLARARSCPQLTGREGTSLAWAHHSILSSTEWGAGRPSGPERPGMTGARHGDLPAGRHGMASVTAGASQSTAQLPQATHTPASPQHECWGAALCSLREALVLHRVLARVKASPGPGPWPRWQRGPSRAAGGWSCA